jgi:hypothetical protein
MQICVLRVRSPRAASGTYLSTYPEVSYPLPPSPLGVRRNATSCVTGQAGQVRSPPFEFNSSDPFHQGLANLPPALRAAVKPGPVNCRAHRK